MERDAGRDGEVPVDAPADSSRPDAGRVDAGLTDAGPTDAGPTDAGPTDGGVGGSRSGPSLAEGTRPSSSS